MSLDGRGLHLRSRLLASGATSDDVQRGRRNGALVPVRRGAYLLPDDERWHAPIERHGLLVLATIGALADTAVVSHVSAAVTHGLPVWSIPLDRVHVTRAASSGGRVGRMVHRHVAPLSCDEIVVVGGVLATTMARTVVDLARTVPFEQAVVIADGALATGLVAPADLAAALKRAAGWRGIPAARWAIAFADGRSESVGESRSRVAIHRAGLPVPVLQWPVPLRDGGTAYTDFGWPAQRTVGEFDGRVKYGRLLRPGQSAGEAVFAEKLREDSVRAEDLGMVRWTWPDLVGFAPTAARLRRTFRP